MTVQMRYVTSCPRLRVRYDAVQEPLNEESVLLCDHDILCVSFSEKVRLAKAFLQAHIVTLS